MLFYAIDSNPGCVLGCSYELHESIHAETGLPLLQKETRFFCRLTVTCVLGVLYLKLYLFNKSRLSFLENCVP
jgi:hypothetical protein